MLSSARVDSGGFIPTEELVDSRDVKAKEREEEDDGGARHEDPEDDLSQNGLLVKTTRNNSSLEVLDADGVGLKALKQRAAGACLNLEPGLVGVARMIGIARQATITVTERRRTDQAREEQEHTQGGSYHEQCRVLDHLSLFLFAFGKTWLSLLV